MMEAEASEVDEREQLKQKLLSRIVKEDGPTGEEETVRWPQDFN
jgi:hypothetical protein